MRKVAVLLAVLVVAVAGFLAGRATLRPPEPVQPLPAADATVEVTTQTVERTLTLTTTVSRATRPAAVNQLTGIVTALGSATTVAQGQVLYAVSGRPVIAVQGAVPFHRDLGPDMKGTDVQQVQAALRSLGYDVKANGTWGTATTKALKALQDKLGYPTTGTLPLGEAVAFPTLPAEVVVDSEKLWLGASLAPGDVLLRTYAGQPSFAMTLTKSQAELVPPGTEVRIQSGEHQWQGVTGEPRPSEDMLSAPVEAPGGGLPCGDECGTLPVAEKTSLLTGVLVVPPVTGPVVPVSALRTEPDGSTTVTVVDGASSRQHPVTVRQIAEGLAVVDGVSEGDTVKVFGKQ